MEVRDIRRIALLAFSFVLLAGLLLQLVILPLTPWHAGNGLMQGGDWLEYHRLANLLREKIAIDGWQAWRLRPEGQAPAGVLGALYVLTGVPQPWVILPLHGLLYALAALALHALALELGASRRAAWGLLLPLFVFPSTAMIWGQVNKDIYSITGILLLLAFWAALSRAVFVDCAESVVRLRYGLLGLFLGVGLIVLVRPYLGQVIVLASAMAAVIVFSCLLKTAGWSVFRPACGRIFLVFALALGLAVPWGVNRLSVEAGAAGGGGSPMAAAGEMAAEPDCVAWEGAELLPASIDARFSMLACAREGFRRGYPGAGSNIDVGTAFHQASDIVFYLPRALQISLLSPFPDGWFAGGVHPGGGVMRLLVIPEVLLLYLALPGMCLAIWRKETRLPVVVMLIFSLALVLLHALVVTNIGTLYRMRYPAMLLWIVIGGVGWHNWWRARSP